MLTPRSFPQSPVVRRNVEFLLERGHRVDLVHMAPTSAHAWAPPVHPRLRRFQLPLRHRRSPALRYVVEYAAFFLLALPLATALALRTRYAAVHVDNLPDSLVFAALAARLRGTPVLLNIVDPMPELAAARLGVGMDHPVVRAARLVERLSVAWASRVTVPNEACRALLRARGVGGGKLAVLHNTLPAVTRAPCPQPGPPVVVCLGTLLWRYGVQVAVDALDRLRDLHPRLTLRIIGSGEYEAELRGHVHRLGLDSRVAFLGFLPWPQAMEEVRRATLGVVPLIADGFGELMLPTKLFDFVQQGLPSVCADLPGIRGCFPAGSVEYFEPGDPGALAAAIDRLLAEPEGRLEMARRAQEALRAFGWERAGPRYLEMLGLAEGVRRAPPPPATASEVAG